MAAGGIFLSNYNFPCDFTIKVCQFETTAVGSQVAIYSNNTTAVSITDTVINSSMSAAGVTVVGNRCSLKSTPSFGTWNNSQYPWTPDTLLPAWDATQASWDYATINTNITTPPQPGTVPYIGYSKGLWGGYRTGIGTGDFGTGLIEVTAVPDVLRFGKIAVNTTQDIEVRVYNYGTATTLVLGTISGASAPFSLLNDTVSGSSILPGNYATVTVRFSPVTDGPFTATLSIPTNDANANPFLIPIIAITGFAQVQLYDSVPIDLGSIPYGLTRTYEITIGNVGDLNLVMGSAYGLSAPFSITSDSISGATLEPYSNGSLTIVFSPMSVGSYSQTLYLPSNDADTPYEISVLGQGLEQPQFTRPSWDVNLSVDEISPLVHITRDIDYELFNAVPEQYCDNNVSPADTEWAGIFDEDQGDPTLLSYSTWDNVVDGDPQYTVDRIMYLHLITEDRYFKVLFSNWGTNSYLGGGFAYTRYEWGEGYQEGIHFEQYPFSGSPAHVDLITPKITLARRNYEGLYNYTGEQGFGGSSPYWTSWSNIFDEEQASPNTLSFTYWARAVDGSPPDMIGKYIYMTFGEGEIWQFQFTQWTAGGGGGMAYTRRQWLGEGYGDPIEFSKPNGAYTTYDVITESIWIGRGPTRGIYNAAVETRYADPYSPIFTLWSEIQAEPVEDYQGLEYTSIWDDVDTWDMIGKYIYMWSPSEERYFEFQFVTWDYDGGSYSYNKREMGISPTPPTPEPKKEDVPGSPFTTIGMHDYNLMQAPGSSGNTEGGHRRGNPGGDQVDNSSGENPAGVNVSQGRSSGKGAYLGMQSVAPNIYKQTSY